MLFLSVSFVVLNHNHSLFKCRLNPVSDGIAYFLSAMCSTAACAQYSPNEAVTSMLAP